MRWQGREGSSNVEDRRGQGGRGLLPKGKGFGILGIVIVLVGAYYGVDLSGLVGGTGGAPTSQLSSEQESQVNELSRVVLKETEDVWSAYFQEHGAQYKAPTMVLYTGTTSTACGRGQSVMGPFYCPMDQKVYLDLSFYEDMKRQLGSGGDAAFAYVIAHEIGHHVQNLLGILPKVHEQQQQSGQLQSNALSVKLELQADCFAGVWANKANQRGLFEQGDAEQAFNAAESVGDDRIQKQAQGYVVPDSFTHGTSAQRLHWFQQGLKTGDVEQCNTLAN
ncbi:KPN_02809 family neutral zinc metallopeptidase [Brackiella oedipodis]|uniref:KPN_02809 family neutral zinc metallopeptidase n=1 Tax=Brackiella oedipodis TaxID=124225 RepID=UPI00048C4F94|nr:neutral zinc metallopeptidase [Brackiella oedipodis]